MKFSQRRIFNIVARFSIVSRLVLALNLTGSDDSACFLDKSLSEVGQHKARENVGGSLMIGFGLNLIS